MGAIAVPGTIHVTSSTAHSGVAMTSTMTTPARSPCSVPYRCFLSHMTILS